MISPLIVDFRDEFYVKTLRRWFVVKCMGANRKFARGVELHRAALVDFLLCNPAVLQRLLVGFGKAQQALNLDEILYRDNIEYGSVQEVQDFAKTCVLLISQNRLSFAKENGELLLTASEIGFELEADLLRRWESEISSLMPLMAKSINVLQNSILGATHGN